jgi:epoxyqueuosine reductase QueG
MNIDELRQQLEQYVKNCTTRFNETDWYRKPLLVTGRVDARFEMLPRIAADNHWLPKDIMPTARTVIVIFFPFNEELVKENHPGKYPCPNWGIAYEATNELIERSCVFLKGLLEKKGYECALTPATDEENLTARWSHKHLGYICGMGRFGINAQMITPSGCAGRMGSFVTDADIGNNPLVLKKELCLYKVGEKCLQCATRCPVKAVDVETGIDRIRCKNRLSSNRNNRIKLGLGERTHGCAKCQVNLPCSLSDPTISLSEKD